jgi:Na+/proline symporter
MTLAFIDWVIIIAYMVFALGIGFYFSKKASASTEEYFLSGRTLPWWVLGTSMVATTFAADTPLAITEFVRSSGIWRNWFWWNVAFAGMVATFLFAPLWRRAEVLTDQELIEVRYSGKAAAFLRGFKALYFSILYNCIVMAWVIAGMTTIIAVLMDTNKNMAVAICCGIALVYSVFSGFWGVVVTDLLQFVIAIAGSFILAIASVRHVGGMDALISKLQAFMSPEGMIVATGNAAATVATAGEMATEAGKIAVEAGGAAAAEVAIKIPNLLDFFPSMPTGDESFAASAFFKFIIFVTMVWWANQNADGGGYLIQRMSAAKNEKHALLASLWFNICHYAVRSWPWIIVGLVSLVLFPDLSSHAYGHKAGYPLVIKEVLGPGFRGLLVVSFLAAFMSTIDTHLNWGSSYLVNDVYRRFVKDDATEGHYVMISKICVIILMALAAISSYFVESISGVWEFVWAMGSGMGMVLILRWFWWRINAYSEITALATSLLVTVGMKIIAYLYPGITILGFAIGSLPVHIKLLIVVPISAIAWITVTMLTPPESDETLSKFCDRVNPGGFWSKFESKDNKKRKILSWAAVGNWFCGVSMIYGALFGVGYLLFGMYTNAFVGLGICGLSFALLYVNLGKVLAITFDTELPNTEKT